MKYFQLLLNDRYDVMPCINGWAQKYDTRFINEKDCHKLPSRDLLFVEPNRDTVFPSVVNFPFFLVTETVFDAVKLYEPGIVSKEVVLLDGQYAKSEVYFMPILKSVDCLHPDTVWKSDRKTFNKIVLDRDKLGKEAIFRPAGASHTIAIARFDLIESILRRGAKGIGLIPLETRSSSEEGAII